jgi:uncharacterized protein YidB (DUF937 family)
MSIFDTVKDLISGGEGGNAGPASHAMELLNDPATGGVQGLVQKFHEQGMGEVVNSWIGSGGNHPITAEQIQSVVGQDRINAIASKFGISSDEASAKIAEYLPTIVDKLTPHGQVEPAQA